MGTVASARHQTSENWDIDETDLAAINHAWMSTPQRLQPR